MYESFYSILLFVYESRYSFILFLVDYYFFLGPIKIYPLKLHPYVGPTPFKLYNLAPLNSYLIKIQPCPFPEYLDHFGPQFKLHPDISINMDNSNTKTVSTIYDIIIRLSHSLEIYIIIKSTNI